METIKKEAKKLNMIVANKQALKFMLKGLNCKVDKHGYITKNGIRVRTISNEEIKFSELGGIVIRRSNTLFVKNDLSDLFKITAGMT